MNNQKFKKNVIFSYNLSNKILFLIGLIFTGIILISSIVLYVVVLKDSNFFLVRMINSGATHLFENIKNTTLLGSFYTTLIGGLFFIFMPVELIFTTFLKSGNNPITLILTYILGFIISFTINYYIGMKLSNISKKIITPKKFYKIKNVVNKYGVWAILMFNALPLPAQPLAAILGVFKYNKAKFYIFFILGQIIKYSIITLGYVYIT